jgi:NitT/TauT family transport system ATP-binding protein
MQPAPVQLSVRNIRKSFSGKAGEVRVLDDLSFHINERDFVSIIGPSGCGKTTIFNIIAGLLEPDSGSMHYRRQSAPERAALCVREADSGSTPS